MNELEIVLTSFCRNLNTVRAISQELNDPVDRFVLMAKWSVIGSDSGLHISYFYEGMTFNAPVCESCKWWLLGNGPSNHQLSFCCGYCCLLSSYFIYSVIDWLIYLLLFFFPHSAIAGTHGNIKSQSFWFKVKIYAESFILETRIRYLNV